MGITRLPTELCAVTFPKWPTSLQIFFQASAAGVQLLLRQREGPFAGKLWEVKVGKLPL